MLVRQQSRVDFRDANRIFARKHEKHFHQSIQNQYLKKETDLSIT